MVKQGGSPTTVNEALGRLAEKSSHLTKMRLVIIVITFSHINWVEQRLSRIVGSSILTIILSGSKSAYLLELQLPFGCRSALSVWMI